MVIIRSNWDFDHRTPGLQKLLDARRATGAQRDKVTVAATVRALVLIHERLRPSPRGSVGSLPRARIFLDPDRSSRASP
jgi:hypothetical protein